jgi:hypothetical protein
MAILSGQSKRASGFSLGEMLAALVIGALILTAILTVYARANRAAEAVLRKIDSPALAAEVFQCLAEDLARVLGNDREFTIQIRNGVDHGFARAELILRRTMRDSKNEEQTFEEITWRGGYDYDGPSPALVIYRAHEGVDVEDKLLDPKRATWESNYPLVPICRGVTFFRIEVPRGDNFADQWEDPTLPRGIRVTLSFAQPYETVRGTWDVPEDDKIVRTIAINVTRAVKFVTPLDEQEGGIPDSNDDGQTPQKTDNRADQDPRRLLPQGIAPRGNNGQTPARMRGR